MFFRRLIFILFSGVGLLVQYLIDTFLYQGKNSLFQVIFDTTQKFENLTTIFPTKLITIHLVNYDIQLSFLFILIIIIFYLFYKDIGNGFRFKKIEDDNIHHKRVLFKNEILECLNLCLVVFVLLIFLNGINTITVGWETIPSGSWLFIFLKIYCKIALIYLFFEIFRDVVKKT
jgi:hypothetical protein